MSKESTALRMDFKDKCPNIKVKSLEERSYPHWKRLVFLNGLNCEEMFLVALYIKDTFSVEGKYNHKSPKLHEYKGCLVLTIDEDEIKRAIISEKVDSF
tara:strand:+ start:2858 stop:3154 length:297 start_codon:yes stop_codon:yes gene_type:complete